MKNKVLFITLLSLASFVHGQFYEYINFGFKTGVNYSRIDEVPEIISQTGSSERVEMKTEPQLGAHFGAFINFHLENTEMSFQSELMYSMEHSQTDQYQNGEKAFTVLFKYNYLQINTLVNYYPIDDSGFSIGLGPQVGINLTPDNLMFQDHIYPERNLELQQEMRNASHGTTNFQLLFNMGYEFRWGLCFNGRYLLGLADVIRTDNNTLNWNETRNTTSAFQFSVGYVFGLSHY